MKTIMATIRKLYHHVFRLMYIVQGFTKLRRLARGKINGGGMILKVGEGLIQTSGRRSEARSRREGPPNSGV